MNCFGLLLCLSTYLLVGTDAAVTIRIMGGAIDSPNEHKYQIALEDNGELLCGGSIISDLHILTAAHCVTDRSGRFTTSTKTVVAGAFDLSNRGPHAVAIDVEKIYIPIEFNGRPGAEGDIAVLKLSRPLCLCEEHLSKVLLPKRGATYFSVPATITGYGWTWVTLHTNHWNREISEKGGSDTQKRKFAITDVLTNAECQHHQPLFPLTNRHICARVRQQSSLYEGTCTGDVGGPLVYNGNVIIGVLNIRPIGCNERTYPGIYARVTSYWTFIHNAMAEDKLNSIKVYEHSRPGPSSRPIGRSRCKCSHGKNK